MKKILFVLVLAVLCLTACKKKAETPEYESFTVTFVQEGQENIIKEVLKGNALTDIPEPKAVEGYDVAWEDVDLSKITQNLTVTAVRTPKNYVITYDLGVCKEDENVSIESDKMEVTYDSSYTLYIPSCKGYAFCGWTLSTEEPITYFEDGIYETAKDITLIAVWEKSSGGGSTNPTTDTAENVPNAGYCTITFAQKGEKNIVKKVKKGKTLTDVPAPKKVDGYDVAWNRTDFTNITQNITVTAVLTAKKYVITYDLGECADDKGVTIESNKQKVTYNKAYTLYTPSCSGYAFVGWVLDKQEPNTYFTDGIYTKTQDITLTAIWTKIEDHEWTNNY